MRKRANVLNILLMTVLANAKHERFAQLVAEGKSASQAYEDAGYKPHRQAASRLLTKVDVATRLSELTARTIEQHDVTIGELIDNYREDRRDARAAKQFGAAVSATTNLAKLCGFMVERQEIRGQIDVRALLLSVSDE